MATRRRNPESQHTFLAVRVEDYSADAGVGVNLDLVTDRPLFSTDDDLVYQSVTHIEIRGTCFHPADRENEPYEIQVSGDESSRSKLTLKDVRARDEYDVPRYRPYRGQQIPVYNAPPGLAVLHRNRNDRTWRAWINVDPKVATSMLVLLSQTKRLYLSIHEVKSERKRWIRSMSLQTTDPATE
jgi:hypothetical protein